MTNEQSIGTRLNWFRSALRLNQTDFAKRLGTSAGRISEIEAGKSIPGGDLLLRMRSEFQIDIHWLLLGETEEFAPQEFQLPPRISALVDNYEHCDEEGKRHVETAALLAAKQKKVRRG